ncbi:MAG TPA: 16S rRNA (guanine(527)-N(7))-methyltransferase RsmG [Polyangia bacterium]
MIEPGLIEDVARSFAVALTPDARAALVRFGDLFLTWNRSINLASLRAPEDLVERHFADSFALVTCARTPRSVVDIGSGGGLPAIPAAILWTEARMDMFEPNRKKAAFLRTAVRELGISGRVTIQTSAVEVPVPALLGGRYDLAMSRATMAPGQWLMLGRALIHPQGEVAVFATQADLGLPAGARTREYGDGSRRLLVFGASDDQSKGVEPS